MEKEYFTQYRLVRSALFQLDKKREGKVKYQGKKEGGGGGRSVTWGLPYSSDLLYPSTRPGTKKRGKGKKPKKKRKRGGRDSEGTHHLVLPTIRTRTAFVSELEEKKGEGAGRKEKRKGG